MRNAWDAKCKNCGALFKDETEQALKQRLADHQRHTQHRDGWMWIGVQASPQRPGDSGRAGVGYWSAVPEN